LIAGLYLANLTGRAYVGEKDTGNTATRVQTLLVALGGIITTRQASLVAGHGVLVRLDTAVKRVAVVSDPDAVVGLAVDGRVLVAQGQVRGGHNLDKVHKIEVAVVRELSHAVQRVDVVVGPRAVLGLLAKIIWKLGSKPELVDRVLKRVGNIALPVVLQIVHVHVAVAETAAGGKVEVANDLVDTQATLDTAALLSLLVQLLGIVLALALLDILSPAKGPRGLRVGLADLVTGLTAAFLLRVGRRRGTVATSTVLGVQVRGRLLGVMAGKEISRRKGRCAWVM
jgi:hypothetical protein